VPPTASDLSSPSLSSWSWSIRPVGFSAKTKPSTRCGFFRGHDMNTQFFSVQWGKEPRRPHVYGRPLLRNETSSWPIFDPDNLDFHSSGEGG
jgi:hypothetical protein